MEVSYRRDLNHNYLILEDIDITGREYTVRMMERNSIPGLLQLELRKINGKVCLYYEITARQPLTRLFEKRSMGSREIEEVLRGIERALDGVQQYLLESRDLLLDPEYIYVDPETEELCMCYVPGISAGRQNTVPILAEFILKKLDHGDRRAVDLGYELYGQTAKDNFSLSEILKLVFREKKEAQMLPEEEKAQEQWEKLSEEKEHGGRSSDSKKRFPAKNILLCGGVVAALALVFGLVVWALGLDLTQTGGLAFLLLALVWMSYNAIFVRQKKKISQWMDEEEEEEDAFLQELMTELYAEDKKKPVSDAEDTVGETRCLAAAQVQLPIRFSSLNPGRYPDLLLIGDGAVIGKQKGQADICLEADTVSRLHAKLERRGEEVYITDLNSRNGTYINGERLSPNERRVILPGDRISIAAFHYRAEQDL